jgi:hypothetical protein
MGVKKVKRASAAVVQSDANGGLHIVDTSAGGVVVNPKSIGQQEREGIAKWDLNPFRMNPVDFSK